MRRIVIFLLIAGVIAFCWLVVEVARADDMLTLSSTGNYDDSLVYFNDWCDPSTHYPVVSQKCDTFTHRATILVPHEYDGGRRSIYRRTNYMIVDWVDSVVCRVDTVWHDKVCRWMTPRQAEIWDDWEKGGK